MLSALSSPPHTDQPQDIDVNAELDFWDDDDIAPGLFPHDDDDEGIEEDYLDAVFSQSQGAPNNLPGAGPPLPSLDEIHTTFIPTHKWPPKAARAEFTRECSDLWGKLAQQPENTQLWKKLLMFPRSYFQPTLMQSAVTLPLQEL